MQTADEGWLNHGIKDRLSSGEGLINEVRDEVARWDQKAAKFEVVDPGVADKRLMVTEGEFSSTLAVMDRPGNTLSSVVRNAWDGRKLSTLTKNAPLCSSNPHISIVGHITDDELRARITRTDAANGFANRFLFASVTRSKVLPHGGCLDDAEMLRLAELMKASVTFARGIGRVEMTDAARQPKRPKSYASQSSGRLWSLMSLWSRPNGIGKCLRCPGAKVPRPNRSA